MSTIDLEDTIRLQLERVSTSATFQQVDRLKRFLRFVVLETAAGRGDRLKEYVIGVEVFAKEASFDPRTDPIVASKPGGCESYWLAINGTKERLTPSGLRFQRAVKHPSLNKWKRRLRSDPWLASLPAGTQFRFCHSVITARRASFL